VRTAGETDLAGLVVPLVGLGEISETDEPFAGHAVDGLSGDVVQGLRVWRSGDVGLDCFETHRLG
jgi:hypothetical protein